MGEQLTMLDTMFLELEQADASAHMHIGVALILDPLPGGTEPTVAMLLERAAGRMHLMPRFSQRLSDLRTGPLSWLTWEEVADFDPAGHLQHVTLPAPGGRAELEAFLADFWSHRLDRHRPLWEITLLDGLADGRWALATKTHHCLVDGVGSIDIGKVLLDGHDAVAPPDAVGDDDGEGRFWLTPGLVLRGAKAGLGAALHPRDAFDKARAAVELVIRDEIIGAPQTSLNVPISGTRGYLTITRDLERVRALKDALGGTVNDVVLAVCAGGLRDVLLGRGEEPPAGLRAQVPVNIRRVDREGRLGNELTSLFVELPVDEPDALRRFERVRDRAAALKRGSQRTGGKAIVDAANMGPPLFGALLARSMFGGSRMFNLTITNVPGPQEELSVFGAPLVDALPFVPLFSDHVFGIAIASYNGRMVFGLTADAVSGADVDVLAAGIERSLAELEAAVA